MIAAGIALRVLGVQRCLLGATLLAWPGDAATAAGGRETTPPLWIMRILGARLLCQGAVLLARPDRRVALASGVVDAAHASTMVAAACALPDYRRVAAVSAGEAAIVAAATCAAGMRLR